MRNAAILALAFAACSAEEPADVAAELDFEELADPMVGQAAPPMNVRGCGDATVAASNATDTQAIFININGIAAAANRAGRPITVRTQLPSPNAFITYETGQRLTSATCVGAFPWPGPQVRQSFDGTGGTLTVVATPTGGGGMPTADLQITLDNPSFSGAGVGFGFAGTIRLPSVGVGLYPP